MSVSFSLFVILPHSFSPHRSLSLAANRRCKWDYADPALQTALYSPYQFTAGWDELTIDRIDTVAGREPRVRRVETRVSPAAVASIFLAKLRPPPPSLLPSLLPVFAPRSNVYVVKPFFPLRDCYR